MNRIIALFLIFSITGCGKYLKSTISKDDCLINTTTDFTPERIPQTNDYLLQVYENASIFIFENGEELTVQIDSGNKLVFEYSYNRAINPLMVDAGYNETILFEVDAVSKKFLLKGSALEGAKAVYGNLCYCPDAGYHLIKEGCIRGRKSGRDEWQVEMNVKAYGQHREFSKMLSEKFHVVK
jgi:hypothetical protein